MADELFNDQSEQKYLLQILAKIGLK